METRVPPPAPTRAGSAFPCATWERKPARQDDDADSPSRYAHASVWSAHNTRLPSGFASYHFRLQISLFKNLKPNLPLKLRANLHQKNRPSKNLTRSDPASLGQKYYLIQITRYLLSLNYTISGDLSNNFFMDFISGIFHEPEEGGKTANEKPEAVNLTC